MSDEPGAEQDQRGRQHWVEHVRARHRIFRFTPPFASCKCRGWQTNAPDDIGIIQQRNFLLDAFNDHLRYMRAEKKRIREAAVAPQPAPEVQP